MPFERAKDYGCVFCVTGKEELVARSIVRVCPGLRVTAAYQEKFKSVKGVKSVVKALMLPGYVFFEADTDEEFLSRFPRIGIIRVLTNDEKDWRLKGDDYEFARWLFSNDGLLGFSTAYREGDQIRFLSGPLKDMEGMICRVDKRGHSGQVAVKFDGREVKLWLGFNLVELMPDSKRGRWHEENT